MASAEHRELNSELQFKVLVIGEFGVGKTAVIRRYTKGEFSSNYKVTIGVDFALKTLNWGPKKINLQLWDIAGHERFGSLTSVYYKYALAAIVVFDLSRPESFQSVLKWVKDVRDKVVLTDGHKLPVILLANKCDVDGITINPSVINNFCKQYELQNWFLTSAKEDINITTAMEFVVRQIFENMSSPMFPLAIRVEPPPEEIQANNLCCR